MAKTDATKRRKRQSKVVTSEAADQEDNVTTEEQTETVFSSDQIVEKDNTVSTEGTEMNQDEQDSHMDTVIEVKGSKSTVTVSWDKKNEEGEMDDLKKRTSASGQMMSSGNGKRKANTDVETSPSKKTKLINDGFCLFIGNLNTSKTFEEVKDSLANYFMKQSLLVQDIRLDKSKKHAFIDLASEMDLTKALTLNGEVVLDKPMKIDKAKIKSVDEEKVKASVEEKKAARDGRCLFLKNVPYDATKEDILEIFHKAVTVRFLGGTEGPSKGIAFVELKNKTIAKKILQKKRVFKIKDRVLIVDSVGEGNVHKVAKANDKDNDTKAETPPNNTLFVSNLSYDVKEHNLKKVFQKAVSITIPQSKGKSRGFALIEFATVEDAEKALQSCQNMKIRKRQVRAQFDKMHDKSETAKALTKTLIVMGLAEKTTAETLKSAFEGALSARVTVDKETGISKGFGFVEFESDENCKAVKEAMEDCEIDGSKVTVAYAKAKVEKGSPAAKGGLARGRPGGQPAGQKAGRGGRKDGGGKGNRGGNT